MRFFSIVLLIGAAAIASIAEAARPGKPFMTSLSAADVYFDHSTAKRTNTDAVIFKALSDEYPDSDITILPVHNCDLFSYAAAGFASAAQEVENVSIASYKWRQYQGPPRLMDGEKGTLVDNVKFGVYRYEWQGTEFIVYLVDGRHADEGFPNMGNQYIIGPRAVVDELILAAGQWDLSIHDEVWIFDQGWWSKDAGLWNSIQKSSWDDIILDREMKDTLIENVQRFFNSKEQYADLRVPWKRGMIFHGPPGNGKTISIKATMHTLYNRTVPVPTLYVKSLKSMFSPPEHSLKAIFDKAREEAPCFLVFEDLDSLVSDDVRSYFLNQVDGVQVNDGILMIGSTNHLERLDPGIAKRPSRFDRKFFFPNPSFEQRVQYCEYWRKKLEGDKQVEFPVMLVKAIANITDEFSFAYIQEAFVASLLSIANMGEITASEWAAEAVTETEQFVMATSKDLEDLLLWRVLRKQIQILRQELESESMEDVKVASSEDDVEFIRWG